VTAPAQIVLRRYPDGAPTPSDFEATGLDVPEPGDGEVLVEVTHLSMDPFPRLRMQPRPPVGPPLPLGEAVDGRGLGRVVASRFAGLAVGDMIAGDVGWRTHAVLPGDRAKRLDPGLGPPERHLSALGPSGMTAYFAMHVVGAPEAGSTVVIAPAAGSVGSLAGQIAGLAGARVVGIGARSQAAALTGALGFDAAVDHRDLAAGLAAACPDGVDLFLDGVGGPAHDAVVARMNPRGRVVLLGFIAGYNDGGPPAYGTAAPILFKRLRVEGFLLADWQARFDEALRQMSAWLGSGELRPVEHVWMGLEQAPAAFAALFGDAPPGKQIVRVQA